MIVLDASALLELLLDTGTGRTVLHRVLTRDAAVHAPHLIDLEVAQTLRRLERAGAIDSTVADEALGRLRALPLRRHAHEPLLDRIWGLRGSLTAYDAAYAALAEVLHATLLTCDARLARAPGISARVELIAGSE